MKTHQAKLFVQNFVNPRHDAQMIAALRYDLSLSDEQEDFEIWLKDISGHIFPNHAITVKGQSLVITHREDPDVIVAVVCDAMAPPRERSEKRFTREALRIVRRCYPYIDKWPHLLRVLKFWTWEEIEAKAKEMRLYV